MLVFMIVLIAIAAAFTLFSLLRGLVSFSQTQTIESQNTQKHDLCVVIRKLYPYFKVRRMHEYFDLFQRIENLASPYLSSCLTQPSTYQH